MREVLAIELVDLSSHVPACQETEFGLLEMALLLVLVIFLSGGIGT